MKPYKGVIVGEKKIVEVPKEDLEARYGESLGYIIAGYWSGHPEFGNTRGWTSLVVKKGRWSKRDDAEMRTCEIETLNSRYTWRCAA